MAEYKNRIAIVLITSYKGNDNDTIIRAQHAYKTMNHAMERGYNVYVNDNYSTTIIQNDNPRKFSEVLEELSKENNKIRILKRKPDATMGEAKRRTLDAAISEGNNIFILMEPEKDDLIQYIDKVAGVIAKTNVDVVVIEREDLSSYPSFQARSEKWANKVASDIIFTDKRYIDMFFGPRAMNERGAKTFINYGLVAPKFGDSWEAIFNPLADIDPKRIVSIKVPFRYPVDQREAEEKQTEYIYKRMLQRIKLITNLIRYTWDRLPEDKRKKYDAILNYMERKYPIIIEQS